MLHLGYLHEILEVSVIYKVTGNTLGYLWMPRQLINESIG